MTENRFHSLSWRALHLFKQLVNRAGLEGELAQCTIVLNQSGVGFEMVLQREACHPVFELKFHIFILLKSVSKL